MIQKLFPTYLYSHKLPASQFKTLNPDLLSESYKFSEIDEKGLVWSQKNYRGGYTSYGSLNRMWEVSSTFSELKDHVMSQAWKFSQELQFDITKKDLRMVSMWINIMPTDVTHSWHIHPHSVLSGTYYVKTPAKCSAIKFEDPRISRFMNTPPRKSSASKELQWHLSHQPKAGEILLFESWLSHEVPPNSSREERVSISFNIDWK